MAIATSHDFLEACRTYRILDDAQIASIAGSTPQSTDPTKLARDSVRRGLLTVWQVNQIVRDRAGELLLGSYVLLEKLGEGGMGAVYKARNWKLGRIVALKVIRKERLDNEDTIRRFRREIQAAGQLWHPNIVRALDADEVNGTHFFVMEYVEGRDLSHVVKEHGPLPVNEACDYIRQAALGLQHAFERGLVHRDIKPSNLLLAHGARSVSEGGDTLARASGSANCVKLLDMGLARFEREADERSSTLTQEGTIMGTPDYIAPEQARDSHSADIRADLYSLGCTLYFLLTGKVPFPGGSVTEKLLKHQLDMPTPVQQFRPDVPDEVAALLQKLLAKKPEERFQTPAELAAALQSLSNRSGNRETFAAPPGTPASSVTLRSAENPFADIDLPASTATGQDTLPRPSKTAPRRAWPLMAASIAGVLLAGAVLLGVLLSGNRETQTETDKKGSEGEQPAKEFVSLFNGKNLDGWKLIGDKQWSAVAGCITARGGTSGDLATVASYRDFHFRAEVKINETGDSGFTFRVRGGVYPPPKGNRYYHADVIPGTPARLLKMQETGWKNLRESSRIIQPNKWMLYEVIANGPHLSLKLDGELLLEFEDPEPELDASPIMLQSYLPQTAVQFRKIEIKEFPQAQSPIGHKAHEEAERKRREDADDALKPLITKAGDAKTTFADFAKDVAAFKAKYGGTPAAIKAAELLMKLPSPLDQLDPKKLPQDCIDYWRAAGREPPGELVGVLGEHRGRHFGIVRRVYQHPDSKVIISYGDDGLICFWDARTLVAVRQVRAGPPAFTADGRMFALADSKICRWNLGKSASTAPVAIMDAPADLEAIAVSRDGKLLALSHRTATQITLWDLTTAPPRRRAEIKWEAGHINAIRFDPDGKFLVTGSHDKTVRLWDLRGSEPKPLTVLEGHGDWVYDVAISPNGKWIVSAGAHDRTARLWSVEHASAKLAKVLPLSQAGCSVAFAPNSQSFAVGLWDGNITLFDLKTVEPQQKAVLSASRKQIWSMAYSSDGKSLATGADGTVRLWDAATGKELQPLTGHAASANAVAYTPDCLRLLSGGSDQSLRLWDTVSGKELRTFPVAKSVASVDFLPDGKHFAYAGDGTLSVSDLDIDTPAWSVEGETLSRLALSPDGRLIFVGRNDGNAYAWNTGSGKQAGRFAGNLQQVRAVAVSPDSKMVAVGSGNHEQQKGDVRVLEIARAHALHQWPHTTPVYCTAFSPDGTSIAAGSQGGVIKIWNLETGTEQASLSHGAHVHGAVALAYAPDGRTLASLGYWQDKPTLLIWDTIGSKLLKELSVPGHPNDIAFAHDGRHLATANADGTVYILRIAEGPPRALSAEEAKKQQEDEAKRLGVPVQMENSLGMKLNLIPAGRFMMGWPENEPGRQANEGPRHEVTLTKPYYMGVYEVTQAEYERVTGKNPSTFNKEKGGGPDYPVEMVSLEDIASFCKKLSELPEEKSAGRVYRLPSEAEWEYACRAGTQSAYYYGQAAKELPRHGWFRDNASDKTRPVGKLSANAWGLYDMHGNAWEWCADVGRTYTLESKIDPIGPQAGPNGALRGGGVSTAGPRWDASNLRSAFRLPNYGIVANNVGFRVVCDYRPPQITNSIGMKLSRIPAGKFLMGSPETEPGRKANEGPQHTVTISKPFYMGIHEVTQEQFQRVTGTPKPGGSLPVESVAWNEAQALCRKLSEMAEEKAAGRVYRLPTEAEWEYACRAGSRTTFSFGDDITQLGEFAWFGGNDQGGKTFPVGTKKPNVWGLFDMHGNVWEWCSDFYQADYYSTSPSSDPQGPQTGTARVYRGGARSNPATEARSANRNTDHPNTGPHGNIGFRVVCEVAAAGQ
jgi:formylglycine-generating enzyme required for sulfatase activity/WD40 repeat protein/serine/threonine protein kinase